MADCALLTGHRVSSGLKTEATDTDVSCVSEFLWAVVITVSYPSGARWAPTDKLKCLRFNRRRLFKTFSFLHLCPTCSPSYGLVFSSSILSQSCSYLLDLLLSDSSFLFFFTILSPLCFSFLVSLSLTRLPLLDC